MDYVRIKSPSLRDTFNVSVQPSCKDASNASIQHPTVDSIKELLKDWIKLYPNSFAPDVEFKIYKLEDGDIIIRLHEDMSTLAVALLVLYLESASRDVTYYTDENKHDVIGASTQYPTAVRFLLEDNYVLDYDFERKPQPVKNCDLQFEESEFSLPEDYEVVKVGDMVKKKIDEFLETEELTPNKLMWYLICGLVGLGIGFLVVYLTGM